MHGFEFFVVTINDLEVVEIPNNLLLTLLPLFFTFFFDKVRFHLPFKRVQCHHFNRTLLQQLGDGACDRVFNIERKFDGLLVETGEESFATWLHTVSISA